MYNVKDFIINESYGESYMNNNIEESNAFNQLEELEHELDYSFYRIPFGPDAVHLIQHEGNFMIPYSDMFKFCKTMNIHSFVEAVNVLSNHYNIPAKKIEIAIEEMSDEDLPKTVNYINDAILAGIDVKFSSCWGDDTDEDECEDCLSLELMYGEDCSLIKPSDENGVKTTSAASSIDFGNVKFIKTIPSNILNFDVSMVNIYNRDFDYYIEMSDIEKYMKSEGIESIKEAIWNIASHNDIDNKAIIILCEKCGKKSNKKKNKKKTACSKLETMNMIASANFDKLNLVWISEY